MAVWDLFGWGIHAIVILAAVSAVVIVVRAIRGHHGCL